ncbi:MAG: hypothetical protein ACXWB0_07910 [Sulfuricurvum sp.]
MKNKFIATVKEITSAQGSTIVHFSYGDTTLRVITLQPPLGLCVGKSATLIIQETRPILIAEPLSGIANTLQGKIEKIDKGEILTRITVNIGEEYLCVLTDTQTFKTFPSAIDQNVFVAFKATDVAIEVTL